MPTKSFPRLRRLCDALPETRLDDQLESLPTRQRLLAFLVTAAVVLTVPPLLVDAPGARTSVSVALAFGVLHAVADLFARYNRR